MLTRGYIIGKIVDDMAGLKFQIETRAKLNLYDLNIVAENFFKDLLNTVYSLSLSNLNRERTNNPGLDLGDKSQKIAFQITSTVDPRKIKQTLTILTSEQLKAYKSIKLLIIGKRKQNYNIANELLSKTNFDPTRDIIDLDDLLKEIMVMEFEALDAIFHQFSRDFRKLKIEFELMDDDGNYESSIYNRLEKQPNQFPKNLKKMKEFLDGGINKKSINKLYLELSGVPRSSRELLAIIGEFGKLNKGGYLLEDWGILPQKLQRLLHLSDKELNDELLILIDADMVYLGDMELEERMTKVVAIKNRSLNAIVSWTKEDDVSLKTLLNTMNFTLLDK
jgi:hypothetical protein